MPGRDEKWKKETIRNTSPEQFRTEFDCEFIGSTNTLVNASKLKCLAFRAPLHTTDEGLKIYEKPVEDRIYAMCVDTSRGVGIDYHAFTVIDITEVPYKLVATFRNNEISPMVYPSLIYKVAKEYNDSAILVELNDIGGQVADILYEEYEYENKNNLSFKNNIYLGKVSRIEPSLQAAFVDFGRERHGFLSFNDIQSDYYQLPLSDLEKIKEEEEKVREELSKESENIEDKILEGKEEIKIEDPVEKKDDVDKEKLITQKKFPSRRYKIQEVIKPNQVILVQVLKDERGLKGAALSTFISIAGKYIVLMPNTAKGGGISRKIFNPGDRKKIRKKLRKEIKDSNPTLNLKRKTATEINPVQQKVNNALITAEQSAEFRQADKDKEKAQYVNKRDDVLRSLRKYMAKLGLADVELVAENVIGTQGKDLSKKDFIVEGEFNDSDGRRIISLAMSLYDRNLSNTEFEQRLQGVLNHEIIHAVKSLGLFTDAEYKSLVKAALLLS